MLGYLSLMSVWVELAHLAEPPGADPHAVVVWGGYLETGILTRFLFQSWLFCYRKMD
jgi:hypothetical protein